MYLYLQKNTLFRIIFAILFISTNLQAQTIKGKVTSNGESLPFVNIYLKGTPKGTVSDENGRYLLTDIVSGNYKIVASFTGFKAQEQIITISNSTLTINFDLQESESMDEIVITGTLKAVSRLDSSVPVEV
ncbi:MAG: carboxypeptidase-like regulatory domain-containing protein, partial [Flavobacteriales bacterium]|nr:carboxypeptidase-like regulatory domain-containing protein [Flavobacteriales bacterium]